MLRILVILLCVLVSAVQADYYDGDSWETGHCNYYDGDSWEPCTPYHYTGAAFALAGCLHEATETTCDDSCDNDRDGDIDEADSDCGVSSDVALAGTLQTVDASAVSGSTTITIDADADVCVVAGGAYDNNGFAAFYDPPCAIGGTIGSGHDVTTGYYAGSGIDVVPTFIGYILQSTIGATGTVSIYWNWLDSVAIEFGGRLYVQCFKNVNTSAPVTAGTTGANGNVTNDQDVTGLTSSGSGDMMVGIMTSNGDPNVSGSSQTVLADEAHNSVYYGFAYKLSATSFDVANGTYSAQSALILQKAE